jgi:hypothetical protein
VEGRQFGSRFRLRLIVWVFRQHQRQNFRNVLYAARAITTVTRHCQARKHGNLPKDDRGLPSHARILVMSVRLSIISFLRNLSPFGHIYNVMGEAALR